LSEVLRKKKQAEVKVEVKITEGGKKRTGCFTKRGSLEEQKIISPKVPKFNSAKEQYCSGS
jgi:hypothetical protein